MSAGFDAAVIGFKALLSSKGESLTFREGEEQVTLTAHVDRQPERSVRPGIPDFDSRDESVVEILTTAVPSAPKPGEAFMTNFSTAIVLKP
jgi:hypothetical protein